MTANVDEEQHLISINDIEHYLHQVCTGVSSSGSSSGSGICSGRGMHINPIRYVMCPSVYVLYVCVNNGCSGSHTGIMMGNCCPCHVGIVTCSVLYMY